VFAPYETVCFNFVNVEVLTFFCTFKKKYSNNAPVCLSVRMNAASQELLNRLSQCLALRNFTTIRRQGLTVVKANNSNGQKRKAYMPFCTHFVCNSLHIFGNQNHLNKPHTQNWNTHFTTKVCSLHSSGFRLNKTDQIIHSSSTMYTLYNFLKSCKRGLGH
jgi:hypothetical protein